jgi:probable rRNA maturation factor
MLSIDIIRESSLWDAEPGVDALLEKAVEAAAAEVSTSDAELAIVLSDDSQIRRLNSEWRGIDKPTNVLSFPSPDAHQNAVQAGPRLLGDVVIAYETTAREAKEEQKPFAHHLSHLAVHGFLHLVGYDHETDADAEAMEAFERTILAQLDVPDPYRADERMSGR